MRCSSACTFGLKAKGIFLGVFKAKGCELGFSWIGANVPKLVNNEGYCETILLLTESTCDNKFNALIAGSPNKLFFMFFTMKTGWVHWLPLCVRVRSTFPRTFSAVWSGPQRDAPGFCRGSDKFSIFHVESDSTVTSAPVSTLNITIFPLMAIWTSQIFPFMLSTVSK